MNVAVGDLVYAEGYGEATVEQIAQFDSLILVRLNNGDTAWTDKSLVSLLDT